MKNNLELWEKWNQPPPDCLKTIRGGRLKGKTDIRPQWRYEVITEHLGLCGFGWYYRIKEHWTEEGSDGQVMCFIRVDLFIKLNDEWSEPIEGVGGSSLIMKELGGLYSNDEAYKMALTDALSYAMSKIGIASDIYMGKWDGSKYADMAADDDTKKDNVKQTSKYQNYVEGFKRVGRTENELRLVLALFMPNVVPEAACSDSNMRQSLNKLIYDPTINVQSIFEKKLNTLEEGNRNKILDSFEKQGVILEGDERNFTDKLDEVIKIWLENA